MGRPPPHSFGQCPKENVFFPLMSSLIDGDCDGVVVVGVVVGVVVDVGIGVGSRFGKVLQQNCADRRLP